MLLGGIPEAAEETRDGKRAEARMSYAHVSYCWVQSTSAFSKGKRPFVTDQTASLYWRPCEVVEQTEAP